MQLASPSVATSAGLAPSSFAAVAQQARRLPACGYRLHQLGYRSRVASGPGGRPVVVALVALTPSFPGWVAHLAWGYGGGHLTGLTVAVVSGRSRHQGMQQALAAAQQLACTVAAQPQLLSLPGAQSSLFA